MKCKYCGHENDDKEQFCTNCGMKLGETPPAPQSDQIRCEKCGFLNPRGADICGGCGQSLVEPQSLPGRCPGCGFDENPPNARFCINCGIRLAAPQSPPEPTVPGAALVLSDTAHIELGEEEMIVGRKDFLQHIPPEEATFISREHFIIFHEDDTYYITDEGSSNGTALNGDEIRGQGKKELHDNDEIVLADTVTLRFKIHS
jgi:hypothetical protein